MLSVQYTIQRTKGHIMFGRDAPHSIIDTHCHIIPGVDDGSRSMQETLKMLTIASDEGISDMIATPHYKRNHRNISTAVISEKLEQISELEKEIGLNVKLHAGEEIYYFSDLSEALRNGQVATMPDGGHVLIEFSPMENYIVIRNAMDGILSSGYTPILAHIERYECIVRDDDAAFDLKNMGVEVQVNASSITGAAGAATKRFTAGLLRNRLIDFIGTDSHGARERTPEIRKCAKLIYKKCDREYADSILFGRAYEELLAYKALTR